MRRLPFILSIILLTCLVIPACEVENCPPNTLSYAHFALVDQYGRGVQITDTITVIGQTRADVENASGETVQDSLLADTIINRENGVESLKLPLSYSDETSFITSTTACNIPMQDVTPSGSAIRTSPTSPIWTAAQ